MNRKLAQLFLRDTALRNDLLYLVGSDDGQDYQVTAGQIADLLGTPRWSTEAANFAAATGGLYMPDCRIAGLTATLDAAPLGGATVYFHDGFKSWGTHALTIDPGAKTIMGNAGLSTINTSRAAGRPDLVIGLRYVNNDWKVLA